MQNLFVSRAIAGMALVCLAFTAVPAMAQTRSSTRRMPDGHPDLQGIYDLATMTPIERIPGSDFSADAMWAGIVEHHTRNALKYGLQPSLS